MSKTYKYKVLAIANSIVHTSYDLGSYNRPVVDKDAAIRAAKRFQARLTSCDVVVERRIYDNDTLIGFETIFNAKFEQPLVVITSKL